jgi:DNA-binding transcriptional MocR family regulator
MDGEGLIPEALVAAIEAVAATGRVAKFLYTVPNYHNPAGVTLSIDRRERVLDIAERHGLLIVEDDAYGLLGFGEEPRPALRSGRRDGVLYLSTFSKTFAPGFRVGWILAPRVVREKLVLASEAQILCPSMYAQAAVAIYLSTMPWLDQVSVFRRVYRERRDAMLDALATLMPPGTSWTTPAGGFYVWLTLPEGLDSKQMLAGAVAAQVAYVPGTGFFADGSGARHLRLAYCLPPPDQVREGVRRLSLVVHDAMAVAAPLGATV